jgi:hypothetical protein
LKSSSHDLPPKPEQDVGSENCNGYENAKRGSRVASKHNDD